MALSFPNVTLLGLNQQSQFFDAGFNYSNTKTLTLNGLVTDLTASFGVTGIWTGVLNTIRENTNFDALILNGVNFGSGRIQDYSFDAGNDVRIKRYTVSVVVAETGNLFNLTGTYYSGINTANWQYLNSFSENYDFTLKENGGYAYTHNAAIQFSSGVGSLNAIAAAKTLAKSIFTGSALGIAFYSGYTSKTGKRFYNESYNLIDNSCDFNETFEFDSYSGTYSVTRTNAFEISDNGIIGVSENGAIRGIVTPTFEAAASALGTETSSAYGRCSGLYAIYAPANSYPLLTTPLVQGRSYDIFQNNLSYTISFSNDIRNSGLYFWSYTQQASYADDVTRVTENGTVQGRAANRQVAFANAQTGYNVVVSPNALTRAAAFYTDVVGYNGSSFLESQDVAYSPYNGTISYTRGFSNEPVIVGTDGIKRIDKQVSDDTPVYLYGRFNIINYKEVLQAENNSTQGNRNLSLELLGERSVPLSVYLSNAISQANTKIPSGIDPVIVDVNYSYTPNENTAQVDVTWQFNKAANRTIFL